MIVNDNGTGIGCLHAGGVEIQFGGVRRPAGGDQQRIAGERFVIQGDREVAVVKVDTLGAGLDKHANPFSLERLGEFVTQGRLFLRQQLGPREHGHLGPKAAVGLRGFQRDNRRSDDRQVFRCRRRKQRFGGGPIRHLGKPRDFGDGRRRTRCDQKPIRRYSCLGTVRSADKKRIPILKGRGSADELDGFVAFQNAFVFGVAQLVDARNLLRQHGATIDRRLVPLQAVEGMMALMLCQLRATDHDFRRHATNVHARATNDLSALDHSHRSAFFDHLEGGRKGARAGAYDGDVQTVAAARRGAVVAEQSPFVTLALQCTQ